MALHNDTILYNIATACTIFTISTIFPKAEAYPYKSLTTLFVSKESGFQFFRQLTGCLCLLKNPKRGQPDLSRPIRNPIIELNNSQQFFITHNANAIR